MLIPMGRLFVVRCVLVLIVGAGLVCLVSSH